MSGPEQPGHEGLVPSGSSALAIRSSGLVKRGLELIRDGKLRKRQIRVLVGDSDSSLAPLLPRMIEDVLNNEREVVAKSTHLAEQLMKYAQSQEFDLCIVYLNNILFPIVPWSARREKVLEFVTQLKQACRSPVIALAGVREDVSLGAEAKRAGAGYFLWTPFSVAEFSEAVNECLIKDGQLKKGKILITDDNYEGRELIKCSRIMRI
jgi:CheY-like chemotaxis protein